MNIIELRMSLRDALRIAQYGCSDGSCRVLGPRTGQRTNGGCGCSWMIRRRLEAITKHLKLEGIQPETAIEKGG